LSIGHRVLSGSSPDAGSRSSRTAISARWFPDVDTARSGQRPVRWRASTRRVRGGRPRGHDAAMLATCAVWLPCANRAASQA
jgi:hypothetical protein